jgi:hypothetical protein
MTTVRQRKSSAAALVAATLVTAGLSIGFAGRSVTQMPAPHEPTPDWFRPIAEHYDLNPAITPQTDFAELHFGDVSS